MATVVTVIEDDQYRKGLHYLINKSEGCLCLASFADYDNLKEYCKTTSPDLILFDIDISFDNALKLIKELKVSNSQTIIIAISSDDEDDRVYDVISNGADGFLIKKIPHSKLIESLKDACNGGAPLSFTAAKKLVSHFQRNGHTFVLNNNYNLSPREKQVVNMLVQGKSFKEVATSLYISIDTVRFHSKNIYRKLKVRNQTELVSKTLRENLI